MTTRIPPSTRHLAYFAAEAYRALYGKGALGKARALAARLRKAGDPEAAEMLRQIVLAIGAARANSSTSLN